MFPKVWFINLIMAGLIVLFGARTYKVWSQAEKAAVEIVQTQKAARQAGNNFTKWETLTESVYETVARNNIFNPERVEPKSEKSELGPEVKKLTASAKTIALYGVILSGGFKTALIAKLDLKPGEKRMQWIKVGDTVGSFKVIEIKGESIIVADGVNQYEVPIYDKGNHKEATAMNKREMKPTVVSAEPVKNPSTDLSTGRAEDSKTASEEDTSETKYQHVKQPSEELRRKIISQYRDLPPPPPPQLNEPTGQSDWSIPLQRDQETTSKSTDSKTDSMKTKPKTGRDWE
jgi:hypothetical protein